MSDTRRVESEKRHDRQPLQAGHHVRLHPVRVYSFHDADRVTHVRVAGYRMVCSCGERGPVRRKVSDARESFRSHGVTPSGGMAEVGPLST